MLFFGPSSGQHTGVCEKMAVESTCQFWRFWALSFVFVFLSFVFEWVFCLFFLLSFWGLILSKMTSEILCKHQSCRISWIFAVKHWNCYKRSKAFWGDPPGWHAVEKQDFPGRLAVLPPFFSQTPVWKQESPKTSKVRWRYMCSLRPFFMWNVSFRTVLCWGFCFGALCWLFC